MAPHRSPPAHVLLALLALLPTATFASRGSADRALAAKPAVTVWCGSDLREYPSVVEAAKMYALPVAPGHCGPCQRACKGRTGDVPSDASACPDNWLCPTVSWDESLKSVAQSFYLSYNGITTPSPLCPYYSELCDMLCSQLSGPFRSVTYNGRRFVGYELCMNQCFGCATAPECSSDATFIPKGVSPCTADATGACASTYVVDNRGITVAPAQCSYMKKLFQSGQLKYICWEKEL